MNDLLLIMRYEIIGDWLNYDAKMRRVHWSLGISYPQPSTHEAISAHSGIALSTVKDKVHYMARQGVVHRVRRGWKLTELGRIWFEKVQSEMFRVACGGVHFDRGILNQIRGIKDAHKLDFQSLENEVFLPVIAGENKLNADFRL